MKDTDIAARLDDLAEEIREELDKIDSCMERLNSLARSVDSSAAQLRLID